jgi:hypothetical protein
MRQLVSEAWQAAVKKWELRPGSVTEHLVGDIMERLVKLVEGGRQNVYIQETRVKQVEERFRTVVVSGFGKTAVTDEVSNGWWITFHDSLTAVRCDKKPDCVPGDIATCTWEFRKP